MRFSIRSKTFLLIGLILIILAGIFLCTINILLRTLFIHELKQKAKLYYESIKKDYNPNKSIPQYIRIKEKGLGGFITVLSSDFQIVYSTSPELRHHNLVPKNHSNEIIKLNESNDTNIIFYRLISPNPNGNGLICLAGNLTNEYIILVEQPLGILSEVIKQSFRTLVISLVIVLFFGLLFAYIFARIITKPVYKISKKVKALANLDFDFILETNTKDEIGDLGKTINKISNKLKHTLKELKSEKANLYELNKKLEEYSRTDTLTQLANRKHINETIETQMYLVKNRQKIFSIILIDIDHFKELNDTYGHQIGDQFLMEFSQLLIENSRKIDVVGRWGGEEFLIILPETDNIGALETANKLQTIIENKSFSNVNNRTASFGVGTVNKGDKFNNVFKQVDKALYIAKNSGRNSVHVMTSV